MPDSNRPRPFVLVAFAALAALGLAPAARAGETLDYAALARRLYDVRQLATLPAAGETSAMFSSYDRASRYDDKTGRYVYWHANDDGFVPMFLRKEGDGEVLAEMKGPGVIWRIWSASPKEGHVRIYLDGAERPAIDLPFSGYFDGKTPPFDHPALSYEAARGHDSYVPIPYGKSCKIVADPGWGQYYQFSYTTFPAGTQVPTFSMKLEAKDAAALKAAGDFLATKLGTDPMPNADARAEAASVSVAPGRAATIAQLEGARAITAIRVRKPAFTGRADEIDALRALAIRITWDGDARPSVWAPLGDFFGTAMGVNKFKTLTSGMTDDGFYSTWYMPFERGAKLELVNDGDAARTLDFEVVHEPLARPAGELGRFHAWWQNDAAGALPGDRWPDWPVLQAKGRGRFCGMMLHVYNPKAGHNWQYGRDGGWWWGEGDEKFFVDGEKFPSTFGTGTEDYFGYAWCFPQLFAKAFHAQTLTQNNKGHQALSRWQVVENVPFQTSFDGFLEKYYSAAEMGTRYASVAYWYAAPGASDTFHEATLADRTNYYDLTDATEGENLKVVRKTGGDAAPQEMMKDLSTGESIWSGGKQLWWQNAKVGDELSVAVPVLRAGKYHVKVGMTKAKDYGIAEISLGDYSLATAVDFYEDELRAVEIDFGVQSLAAGDVPLTIKIVGANGRAAKKYLAGIDYVKLVPAK